MATPDDAASAAGLHVVFGAGPLGRAVAREAGVRGARVRLVSRRGGGLPGIEGVSADAADPAAAAAACRGASVVYQCAAPPYHRWPELFPALQDSVLRAAKAAGAVLVAAENLYGYGVAGVLHEGLPSVAATRKGRTRAEMSARLFEAHSRGDVRAVSARAADFFGPEARTTALGERFWPQLLRGRTIGWFGDPDAPHSFTYLPDFARALVRLGGAPATWGRAWHAPSPEPLSVRALAARAAARAGLPAPALRRTPKLALRAAGLFIPAAGESVELSYAFDQPFVLDDISYRRAFRATATPWDAALDTTLAWWRSAQAAA